ncbi:major facilitator superfamily domain-containing protein [Pestalotiopsis sp. NC0098]|nr:major facilitator superfamily domain-containing protein [Pestalotiopsis sp. NC0098]
MTDTQAPTRRSKHHHASTAETEPLLAGAAAEPGQTTTTNITSPASSLINNEHPDKHEENRRDLVLRIVAAMFAFMVMGMIQSVPGVLIPHLENYYGLSDTYVSVIFLISPVGYFLAAYMTSFIHLRLGQLGIAIIGPACQLVYALGLCAHPPYWMLLFLSLIEAVGTGLLDGSWCAWAGAMTNGNTVQGFLHGSYSIGASLGPLIAGTMISVGKTPWYYWFYVLSGFCIVMLASSSYAFRFQDGKKYRAEKHDRDDSVGSHDKQDYMAIFKYSATWICAAYFLSYVGIEASITGWIVVYMLRARHASGYLASMCSALFNIGMAIGRLALGVVTDKLGVRTAVVIYLSTTIVLQTLFALIEVPAASAVLVTLVGFFLGPMFPSGVVLITRLLPPHLHVGTVSFVASTGQIGGALLPFALGAIADRIGIGAFQYIILAQLIVTLLIWLCFPRLAVGVGIISPADEEDIVARNEN